MCPLLRRIKITKSKQANFFEQYTAIRICIERDDGFRLLVSENSAAVKGKQYLGPRSFRGFSVLFQIIIVK